MKDLWMSQPDMNEFSSIDELRGSLFNFVNGYNKTVHSSLNGKTPENRFFEEGSFIRRLSDEDIETSFLLDYERRVSADNVIVLNETEYKVPYIYAKQKITLRYSADFKTVYVVNRYNGELTPIKLLNKHDNAHIKREKIRKMTTSEIPRTK